MIKRVLTLVSGDQESCFSRFFISQNCAQSQNLSKNVFIKNFFAKMKKLIISFKFFGIFELILCAVIFDYSEIVAIVKMCAVTEKETARIMHEIVLVIIIPCGFR